MANLTVNHRVSPTKIERLLTPVEHFIHQNTSAGLVMILFLVLALAWANSPWYKIYEDFLHYPITFGFGSSLVSYGLSHWVNDGLMTIFFFLVGLEIKREFLAGELSNREEAVLPIVAALGGMAVPALVYLAFNWGTPYAKGWAIPTATDIAFAMGALSLLGSRVPLSLKVFLTALAIADDIGAIIIIALFYGGSVQITPVIGAAIILGILFIANRLEVRSLLFYGFFSFILWIFILQSGIHATLAGVLAAMTVPFKSYISERDFVHVARKSISRYEYANLANGDAYDVVQLPDGSEKIVYHDDAGPYYSLVQPESVEAIQDLQNYCTYVESPLRALERILHLWVSFLIVPLFTLCNAGIRIETSTMASAFADPVTLGVAFGLAIGKPIGIFSICFITSKLGLIRIAKDITWTHLFGAGCLAGIGFTMSLFVANLAFGNLAHRLNDAKIGILTGSFFAVFVGLFILMNTKKAKE